MSWEIRQGDVLERLREMDDESVHCVVTSPPYWGLRDYGVEDQLGLESTPEEYVTKMVQVFREVRRVLRSDGTCWLNLGDSYATGGGAVGRCPGGGDQGERFLRQGHINTQPNRMPLEGLKSKDLIGVPWRVAFALQSDGWWLRSDIIWAKPNPMPESVTDRPTKAHEYVFLLTRSSRYFYDAAAILEPTISLDKGHASYRPNSEQKAMAENGRHVYVGGKHGESMRYYDPAGRNKRTVWTITTKPYAEAHFATFPPELPEICIKAGTSEKGCCAECGAPWERLVDKDVFAGSAPGINDGAIRRSGGNTDRNDAEDTRTHSITRTTGWQPTCNHDSAPNPCTVLDPFAGSGTTLMVALRLGRNTIGIELNPEYVKLAENRIDSDCPLFNREPI